jgi:hypothetical protein
MITSSTIEGVRHVSILEHTSGTGKHVAPYSKAMAVPRLGVWISLVRFILLLPEGIDL